MYTKTFHWEQQEHSILEVQLTKISPMAWKQNSSLYFSNNTVSGTIPSISSLRGSTFLLATNLYIYFPVHPKVTLLRTFNCIQQGHCARTSKHAFCFPASNKGKVPKCPRSTSGQNIYQKLHYQNSSHPAFLKYEF